MNSYAVCFIHPDFICTTHTWNSGTVTEPATCKKAGKKIFTCTVCGETKEESFAGEHKYEVKSKIKATLKKDGKIKKKCSVCRQVKSERILHPKIIRVKNSRLTYTGSSLKPDVIIRDKREKKIKEKYYTVKYSNNKSIGVAKALVQFKGKYKGKKVLSFKIYPRGTEIVSLTGAENSIKVRWNRKNEAAGYQIQYALNSNFKKKARTVKISNKKATDKRIKGFKSNRKYYVRVRTYSKSLYSAWSSVKTVVTEAKEENVENDSYDTVISKYRNGQGYNTSAFGDYSAAYYDYLDLKTPYGIQNALLITTYHGAYNMYSIIYIRDGNGKIIEYFSHPGQVTKISNDKDKLLLYGYIGSGMGSYYIMDYIDSGKNYVESTRYDFEMDTRESTAELVDSYTKGYNVFEAGMNKIFP